MTTTTGTTEHPDVSEISDLTEGLLSPARSTEVREHLDGCALCADVHESLKEIRGLLGSLPGPPRMPADVAARVDAALAAEALLNATADVSRETSRTAETATDSNVDTASHEPERDSEPEEAEPAPTAVTPGATAPGATAADLPRADRPAGRPRAATGPGRTRRLRRRRGAILGAVFGTAAIGVSVLLFQTASSNGGGDYKADAGASQADSSGDVFSGTGIQDKVHSLLASTPASGMPQMADGGTEGENSTKEGTTASPRALAQLPPCVQQATGRTDSPLAAEKGTYNGVEAFLVVLSDPVDGSVVRAYVIDAACVDVTPPVKGDLLLTKTYPRH
ncbi:zf-HC2 domain-containing protein [Streptomyces sp. IB2014 016-6]|uniref:anti-sigma factor family protein n=1 Tax=Streptomyces sp. IB2014 016-6 TaxID=2517818 RepID=UPI0011CB342D|nr:zf-HC2 domain-containing protein [Streptomyces sp. IB2014 016-6]TXL92082.1 zf-HC2 domain-containing protein [Streptomyces sp. IB2014 016-6]